MHQIHLHWLQAGAKQQNINPSRYAALRFLRLYTLQLVTEAICLQSVDWLVTVHFYQILGWDWLQKTVWQKHWVWIGYSAILAGNQGWIVYSGILDWNYGQIGYDGILARNRGLTGYSSILPRNYGPICYSDNLTSNRGLRGYIRILARNCGSTVHSSILAGNHGLIDYGGILAVAVALWPEIVW